VCPDHDASGARAPAWRITVRQKLEDLPTGRVDYGDRSRLLEISQGPVEIIEVEIGDRDDCFFIFPVLVLLQAHHQIVHQRFDKLQRLLFLGDRHLVYKDNLNPQTHPRFVIPSRE